MTTSPAADKTKTPPAAAPTRFTVEPTPTWVKPVQQDSALAAALPKSPVHILLSDVQIRLDQAGGVSRYQHAIRQVNESSGLDVSSQIQIEFDPAYQRLAIHKIDVWRNGVRIDKLDKKKIQVLQRETQLERQMVDGRLTASMVLDDVRVGDRVEFAYSVVGDNPVFEGKFFDIDWAVSIKGPMALNQYRLLAPQQRAIQLVVDPTQQQVDTEVRDGWKDTVVRRTKVPQFQMDSHRMDIDLLVDQIQVSEFASWKDVADWAIRVFAPAEATPTPALRAQADALSAQAPGDAQKQLLQTLDFVQTEIRYFGTEVGPNSHRPAQPGNVLQQRYGDCKDKVSLLIALLKAQGIAARPLLVSSYLRGDVARMLPSPLAFNHVVAIATVGDKSWVLDGTRNLQKGPLDEREFNYFQQGLLVKESQDALLTLPDATRVVRVDANDIITVAQFDGTAVLQSDTTYHGEVAEAVRSIVAGAGASEFERQLQSEYAKTYQVIEPMDALKITEIPGRNALRAQRSYKISRYWKLGEQYQLQGDWALGALIETLKLPTQTPRTTAVRLSTPGTYRHRVQINFAEKVYPRERSQKFDETSPLFELHLQQEVKPERSEIQAEVRLVADRLQPADWSAHRDKLIKIWPRLSGSFLVPSVSLSQSEKLTEKVKAIDEDLRRGKLNYKTSKQVESAVGVLIAQARLASNRLNTEQRAKVLVDQGTHLDHLTRYTEAKTSFEESIKLDPKNSEAYSAMAVNALMRGDDAMVFENAAAALKLAPNDTSPRYTRGYAYHYANKLPEARDEFLAILKNPSDRDSSYAALWLYLTTRKLSGDAIAAIQQNLPRDTKPTWPYPVLQVFNETLSADGARNAALEDKATAQGRLCELYFFLGKRELADGKARQARDYFQKAVATGVSEFTEHTLALRELALLDAAK